MQSQIREVMNRSQSPSIPPGHGEPEYLGPEHPSSSSYNQQYTYGGHNSSMVNDTGYKTPRPSHLKNFSSRFSTTSYSGGAAGKEITEEQRIKRAYDQHQQTQMTWLDRKRQHKNFALYTFLMLNAAMILVIILAAVVWVALHLIRTHRTIGIPVNSGLSVVSSQ